MSHSVKKSNALIPSSEQDRLVAFDRSWKSWTLRNGLRCIHVPLPAKDFRFHCSIVAHTGSRNEDSSKAGISHLLEHMMFRGTKKYPSFSKLSEAIEGLGGEWNAATGHEYTEFFYSGTKDNVENSIELLGEIFLYPEFNDLETERRIVLRELEGELNENGESTDIDYHVLKLVWPNSSLSRPIIGIESTLLAVRSEDLKVRINSTFVPRNTILCAVGGQYANVKRVVEKNFSNFPTERANLVSTKNFQETLLPYIGPKMSFVDNSDNEFEVQISFVCEGTNSSLTPVYDMISRILGDGFSSRLVKRIREELGLVYDISCGFHQYSGGGLFSIQASISEMHIETFFRELYSTLRGIVIDDNLLNEIRRHRTRALSDLKLIPSDPSSVAFRLGWHLLTGADSRLKNWQNLLEGLSAQDIVSNSLKLFCSRNLAVAILGPKDAESETRFQKAIFDF